MRIEEVLRELDSSMVASHSRHGSAVTVFIMVDDVTEVYNVAFARDMMPPNAPHATYTFTSVEAVSAFVRAQGLESGWHIDRTEDL